MAMTKSEKFKMQKLEYANEDLVSRLAKEIKNNHLLSRMVEILCDRFSLTDEQRDEIRCEALKE